MIRCSDMGLSAGLEAACWPLRASVARRLPVGAESSKRAARRQAEHVTQGGRGGGPRLSQDGHSDRAEERSKAQPPRPASLSCTRQSGTLASHLSSGSASRTCAARRTPASPTRSFPRLPLCPKTPFSVSTSTALLTPPRADLSRSWQPTERKGCTTTACTTRVATARGDTKPR